MKRRDLILFIISCCQQQREFGRTSLQKVAFFVEEHFGEDDELGYRPHYFGPFSDVVVEEVNALTLAGLVEERVQRLGFVGASGFEGVKYEYSLTDVGSDRVAQLRDAYPAEAKDVEDFIGRLLQAAGGLDQAILAPAAKTYFIAKREDRVLEPEEIKTLAKQLGWVLSDHQIGRVVGILKELDLIEEQASE